MGRDYIPESDADLRDWARNFSNLIDENPSRFALVPADAATIREYVDNYASAFRLSNDPSTRTTPTIGAKDSARAAMLPTVRYYAQRISQNLGIGYEDKLALRITVRKTTKTPIPPPQSIPVLNVRVANVGQHVVRFEDTSTPNHRAKPPGASALQLFVALANERVGDPEQSRFVGLVTRQLYYVTYNSADNGRIATYFARWTNKSGDVSGWSAGKSVTIAF